MRFEKVAENEWVKNFGAERKIVIYCDKNGTFSLWYDRGTGKDLNSMLVDFGFTTLERAKKFGNAYMKAINTKKVEEVLS